MAGNVGEWVEDCYHDTYSDAPNDGSAVKTCLPKFHKARVMHGGFGTQFLLGCDPPHVT